MTVLDLSAATTREQHRTQKRTEQGVEGTHEVHR